MKKPLVIYHKDCADGIAAAWCFWKHYKDTFEYYGGIYNEPLPDVFNRDVYLVDFSYKRDAILLICEYANNVTLLDHHKSALEDLWDLAKVPNFDMSHSTLTNSGAVIAWNYVKKTTGHNRKQPAIISYIQDRDLWEFNLPNTKEIMTAVFAREKTIQEYDKLMKLTTMGLKDLIKEGIILDKKYKLDLINLIKQCQRIIEFEGYKVPMANLNGLYASEAGNIMAENYPFAITYYDTEKYRVFSLRSKDNGLDVSQVAKKFNGGGHYHASGFKVERDHFLAKI